MRPPPDTHQSTSLPGEAAERVLVALCTFNERQNLPTMLEQIHAVLPTADILVVDDNSPDGTGAWATREAERLPHLRVLVRKHARGLGGALRAAIEWAVGEQYEWLLNLDADHSHDPAVLPVLLATARDARPPRDCVVGTRYGQGGMIDGWTWRRRLMSRLVNRFATSILRLPVSDCSGSLRCYRVAALAKLDLASLRSNGYAIFEELLVRLRRRDAHFDEVPITFHERRAGNSKLTLREAVKAASQIIRLAGQ